MLYGLGFLIGALLVVGVIAFSIRQPIRPPKKRRDIDHDAWTNEQDVQVMENGSDLAD